MKVNKSQIVFHNLSQSYFGSDNNITPHVKPCSKLDCTAEDRGQSCVAVQYCTVLYCTVEGSAVWLVRPRVSATLQCYRQHKALQ